MRVILSIKPIYAEKILKGEKIYELRRSIFKIREVKNVIIYASAPISKVIGEFEIEGILHEKIDQLWQKTGKYSAVDKGFFDSYFADKDKGYAIKIKSFKKYEKYYDILETYGVKAPQSFAYVDK